MFMISAFFNAKTHAWDRGAAASLLIGERIALNIMVFYALLALRD
jgi:hypothetical protein